MSGSGSAESSGDFVKNLYESLTPEQRTQMQNMLSQNEGGPSQEVAAPAPTEESSTNPYYDVDPQGNIIANRKGRVVWDRIYSLCQRYFGDRLFSKWSEQPAADKRQIIATLRDEFQQEEEFDEKEIHKHMSLWIRHRRDMARRAYRDGQSKPSWCSRSDWNRVKADERTPDKYKIQKDAAAARMHGMGNPRLGSSGKAGLQASMLVDYGRLPTKEEYEFAFRESYDALVDKLKSEGHPPNTGRHDDGE